MSVQQTIAGRFAIENLDRDLLGRGGMGSVYRGSDLLNGVPVAVKVQEISAGSYDVEQMGRFVREGDVLRQLNHPNIVQLLATSEEDGRQYIIMEYVAGGTLEDLIDAQGRLSIQQSVALALDIADALTRAHRLGIIHRDIKPSNVLLAEDGTPRLTDFGIAYLPESPRLTQTGVLVGTVDYLSPEACQGKPLDARADIWAFGVLLFNMLTGELPFQGDTLTSRLTAILTQPAPDLAQIVPEIPERLAALIKRMLEKDREVRIASVRMVGVELEAIQIGRNSDDLGTGGGSRFTPQSAVTVPDLAERPMHNLPTQLTSFIGREVELGELATLLHNPERRLVTIIGTGGMGKTRLALQTAGRLLKAFPDGVWLIELAPITDPDLIPLAVANTLGLQQDNRPALTVLSEALRPKTMLLVLDNCEHLVEACARLVETLLRTCPGLRFLASTREAFGIAGEAIYRLPSLQAPNIRRLPPVESFGQYPAVQLFVERACVVLPEFRLTAENAVAVAQVCWRLDGIPLAIELAATRVSMLRVEQIAARLDDRFRLLTGGSRTALPRQQTLRAAIDWSYDLLTAPQRMLLQHLTVFSGGWRLDAAEEVCACEEIARDEVLNLLSELVNKSLVIAERRPSQETRYRLLETVRQYGRDRLLESGHSQQVHERHLSYFLRLAEQADPHTRRLEQVEWLDRLDDELDNFRMALDWASETDLSAGLQLTGALGWYFALRGQASEGLERFSRMLAQAAKIHADIPLRISARATNRSAWLAMMLFNYQPATELADQCLRLARQAGDDNEQAFALSCIGFRLVNQREYAFAAELFEQSLLLYRQLGDIYGERHALDGLSRIAMQQRDYTRAATILQEELALARQSSPDSLSWTLYRMGELAYRQGDNAGAMALLSESLSISQRIKERTVIPWILAEMGNAARMEGNFEQARSLYQEAVELDRDMGAISNQSTLLMWLGEVLRLEGDLCRAAECYTASLELVRQTGDLDDLAWCYTGIAGLAGERGQTRPAAVLLGAVHTLKPNLRTGASLVDLATDDHAQSAVRGHLEPPDFEAAITAGQALTPDQASELAEQLIANLLNK
jgi:non-specific serine/threonine protein kinase